MEMQNNACSDPYQGIDCDEGRYSKDTIVWYPIEKFGFAEGLKSRYGEAGHCESQMVNRKPSGDTNDGVELTAKQSLTKTH
jgi:hypothetical protein